MIFLTAFFGIGFQFSESLPNAATDGLITSCKLGAETEFIFNRPALWAKAG
jgi:hypothetical protein